MKKIAEKIGSLPTARCLVDLKETAFFAKSIDFMWGTIERLSLLQNITPHYSNNKSPAIKEAFIKTQCYDYHK